MLPWLAEVLRLGEAWASGGGDVGGDAGHEGDEGGAAGDGDDSFPVSSDDSGGVGDEGRCEGLSEGADDTFGCGLPEVGGPDASGGFFSAHLAACPFRVLGKGLLSRT